MSNQVQLKVKRVNPIPKYLLPAGMDINWQIKGKGQGYPIQVGLVTHTQI